jgi:hypothetical protein
MIVNINQIKPNPKNPRIIRDDKFKKLQKSLLDFPDMLNKRPLVVFTDKDNKFVVLGGNMRLKAAKEIGITELPVIVADEWTEEQKTQFLIKDNLSYGDWNLDELKEDWDTLQLEDWGVDIVFPQEWNKIDYIDEEQQPPLEKKNNTITIVLPEAHVEDIKEIEKYIKEHLDKEYSGCDIK